MLYKKLLLACFEPVSSSVGRDRSANCATTTTLSNPPLSCPVTSCEV